jgi:hypothetical protein
MVQQRIVYEPAERPDVEVLVDDAWHPAEIRMATQDNDGTWRFNAQWRRDHQTYLDTFTESQVRTDTVDRGAGRG